MMETGETGFLDEKVQIRSFLEKVKNGMANLPL